MHRFFSDKMHEGGDVIDEENAGKGVDLAECRHFHVALDFIYRVLVGDDPFGIVHKNSRDNSKVVVVRDH